jgi:hypothetical protein
MKLLAAVEMMEAQSPLPLLLVRFIGMCEVAGALGMLLPGLLRIRPSLTPLAAAGLVVLMSEEAPWCKPRQPKLRRERLAVSLRRLTEKRLSGKSRKQTVC